MKKTSFGTFFNNLWHGLTAPHQSITEQSKRWQARLTAFMTLVIFIGVGLNVLIDGGLQALILAPLLLGYLLSRTRHYTIASYIILITLLGAILYSLLEDGDFHKYAVFTNIAWLSLSLLLASLLFSVIETIFISLAHIAILLLMVWFVPEIDLRAVGVSIGFMWMFSALLIATMWQRNWLERMRQQEIHLQATALESSDYAVMIINKDGEIIWINPAFTKLTGFSLVDIYAHDFPFLNDPFPDKDLTDLIWDTLYQGQTWQGVVTNFKQSGQQYDESMIITPVQSDKGEISHFVAIKHDITEQIAGEERLKFLATHDLLTSLPNRGLFHDRLRQALARAKRNNLITAVLYLDLDNFKQINDAYSHEDGDHVLMILAQRMMSLTRETDTVARLSGDEFVILLEDVQDEENVSLLTERLLYEISKPIELEHIHVTITASIGIAMYPKDGEAIVTLLQNADVAMYHGKSKGKNSYIFFTEGMQKDVLKKVSLGKDMLSALSNSEFTLEYQPIFDLRSSKVTRAEALIRWQHPEEGTIYPNEFIPLAEESNLILPIGEWVLRQSISALQDQKTNLLNDLQISINLSGHQLRDDDHFQALADLIETSQIDPALIQLEVTETSIFENVIKATRSLKRFRRLGVKLAIDDFGTGYSSLSYLEQFPIDTIKVDMAFIRRITSEEIELPILNGIISIVHEMGMEVIAEGVETQVQLDYLKNHGCFLVQGFYLHSPMSRDELVRVVEAQ